MHSKGNSLNIVGIKTNNGYLISDQPTETYYESKLKNYFINGEKVSPSFHRSWSWSNEEPTKIEMLQSQPRINHRYELTDPSLESEKFPLIMMREDVATYDSDECEWEWKEQYRNIRSLYKTVSDEQPSILVPVEFTYKTILELDEVKEFNGFAYPIQRTQWRSDGLIDLTPKDVTHQLLDRILFPDPVLPMRPCKFTSEQMYKIVRQYIKQHINYEVAEITSDYDFCFTVKKKIKLEDPLTREIEILNAKGNSYKNKKYRTSYTSNRSVEVFEMTYSPKNYERYTPIPAFFGENIEDLKNKVDAYLKEIIEMINEPLVDCPHCKGMGVTLK